MQPIPIIEAHWPLENFIGTEAKELKEGKLPEPPAKEEKPVIQIENAE